MGRDIADKTWSDQPDDVIGLRVMASVLVNHRRFEVRRAPNGEYYITTGNLFGSQTVRCEHADAAWAVLHEASKSTNLHTIPPGVTIMRGHGPQE